MEQKTAVDNFVSYMRDRKWAVLFPLSMNGVQVIRCDDPKVIEESIRDPKRVPYEHVVFIGYPQLDEILNGEARSMDVVGPLRNAEEKLRSAFEEYLRVSDYTGEALIKILNRSTEKKIMSVQPILTEKDKEMIRFLQWHIGHTIIRAQKVKTISDHVMVLPVGVHCLECNEFWEDPS